jgi:hypothetical protein
MDMAFLRAMIVALFVAVVGVPVADAASTTTKMYVSAEAVASLDARVVRTVNSFKRDGYVEAGRTFNQVMYLVAPTEDYRAGEYVITLRKSAGNYSLTTYYADVHVEVIADIETGKFYAGRIWTEESVVH